MSSLLDDHHSSLRQSLRRLAQVLRDPIKRPRLTFLETLHGREVKVEVDGTVPLFWKRQTGEEVKAYFRVSPALHTEAEADKLILVFNAAGITLQRQDGQFLSPDTLFPFTSFSMQQESSILRELWTAELERRSIPIPAEAQVVAPISNIYGPAGKPPVGSARKRPFGPVVTGDAQWLVKQFLDGQFPEGSGAEYATCKVNVGTFRSIWPLWMKFLDRHPMHPHHKTWIELYSNADWKKPVSALRANILFFRHLDVSDDKQATVSGTKVYYRTWKIGRPGSGLG